MAVLYLKPYLKIPFNPVERPNDQRTTAHFLSPRMVGVTSILSATAFSDSRFGVAALESEARAMNHAFGISDGRPTGMPANFGVLENGWCGSSNSGAVQLMQA